jgi:hypothetical protein
VRRHRRALGALIGVAFLAGFGANGARAQSIATGSTPTFGGFKLESHGEGVTFTYNSPGLIPGTPSPLFAASLPESLTNMDSGPSAYALASLVYPGPLVADLPSVLALGGVPNADKIPAYPVRSQAFYPSGPTDASQDVGSGRETVATTEQTSNAQVVYGAMQAPPVLDAGAVTSTSASAIEDGQLVTRTRVEMTDVDLILGLVHMDSVVTDLVATSTGTDGATAGATTVSGITVLGQPATLDSSGLHLVPQTPPSSTSSAGPLGPLVGPLQSGLDPLNQLLQSTLGEANADINQLLARAGITVQLFEPTEVKSAGDVSRLASGVLVTLTYDGSTEPVLSNILNLIPIESVPSQNIGPIPFSSPQSLVLALKATHIETVGLAAGNVHAGAAAPFSLPSLPITGSISGPSIGGASGFTTPTPAVTGGGNGGGGDASIGSASPLAFVTTSPLAGALSALFLLMAGWFFWFGSGRLADNVLSVASSSCPEGLDRGGPT